MQTVLSIKQQLEQPENLKLVRTLLASDPPPSRTHLAKELCRCLNLRDLKGDCQITTTAVALRGMAPSSRKDLGFFAIPPTPQPAIILCESAIDALSCHALHPQHRCISTAGARPNPRWLPALIGQAQQIYCGFDADPTGNDMARALISLYPTVQRLRPSLKDWNDALRSAS